MSAPKRAPRSAGVATRVAGGIEAKRTPKSPRPLGGSDRVAPSKRMTPSEIDELFLRLSDANPAPTTELEYSTPYELLVAVALSAQMTDVGVNKATRRLFPAANTPAAIARLGVDGLLPYIAGINFNRTKAANVVAMASQLIDLHGGEVPRDREALEALPGVGRKTANVVLNTAFGEMTLAVDTHIFRVSNRTGLAPGADVRTVEDELHRVVPERYLQHAHHWLLLHGRYVCKARVPDCPRCIVRDLCHFPDKTPGEAPPLEVAPARAKRGR
ncbi:endonuclease III [Lysobacter sp. PAGU 2638]